MSLHAESTARTALGALAVVLTLHRTQSAVTPLKHSSACQASSPTVAVGLSASQPNWGSIFITVPDTAACPFTSVGHLSVQLFRTDSSGSIDNWTWPANPSISRILSTESVALPSASFAAPFPLENGMAYTARARMWFNTGQHMASAWSALASPPLVMGASNSIDCTTSESAWRLPRNGPAAYYSNVSRVRLKQPAEIPLSDWNWLLEPPARYPTGGAYDAVSSAFLSKCDGDRNSRSGASCVDSIKVIFLGMDESAAVMLGANIPSDVNIGVYQDLPNTGLLWDNLVRFRACLCFSARVAFNVRSDTLSALSFGAART